jgi:CheY-like chemotaxis protein
MQGARAIIVIEDDMDDQEFITEAFNALNYTNPVIFFSNGNDALDYLHQTSDPPVLILSDINMPKMNGFEVKKRINKSPELRKLDIPFVFLSTLSKKEAVSNAHSLTDHDFFTKPYSMGDLRNTIKDIVEYWVRRYSPAPYNPQPANYNGNFMRVSAQEQLLDSKIPSVRVII